MKIVADENIPCVEQAFSTLGDVTLLPGRSMRPEQVRDADILLVRS
ncbi:MAG: 4-phosphoerythronate dehydrogenase, partial [Pseudomonadota bacterium]|nr:4-phosphoerythronate dehydrogenase [Pseudomonadota bacterium]